ncbi:hypothetical protein RG47T_1260 [Mucilaginibacter polytrichastri]|uniref:Uncharacterized protein n=1 Tax=Mucilaginibacter polytrichastri TaxID=1302689 RepID=A0A1Q5ZVL0_9SPHI|nr:hypothetical protein RG47T_1260 [Mucilaginibacter polytrichastri]
MMTSRRRAAAVFFYYFLYRNNTATKQVLGIKRCLKNFKATLL